MAVYLFRSGDSDAVKIGYAVDPASRLASCQTGNPFPLSIIRTVDGGREVERWFHKEFKHLRVRGEWFTFDDRMLTAIPDLSEEKPKPVEPEFDDSYDRYLRFGTLTPHELDARAKAAGTTVYAILRSLGIAPSVFTRWRNGDNSIRLVTYEKIVNALWRFTHEGND